jgi:hypothetical protein
LAAAAGLCAYVPVGKINDEYAALISTTPFTAVTPPLPPPTDTPLA